jgi:hypothetical protein
VPIGWETGWAPVTVWTLWRYEKSLAYAWSRTMVPLLSGPRPSRSTLSRFVQFGVEFGIGNTRRSRLRQVGRGRKYSLLAYSSYSN